MEEKVKYIKTCENCDWDGVCPHSYKEYDLRRQNKQLQDKLDKIKVYVSNIKSSGTNSHFDAPVIKEKLEQIIESESE